MRKIMRPAEARNTAIPVVSYSAMWLEMQSRGYWLTSADRFLVEIAAHLMARYRVDELKSGDVSLLIRLVWQDRIVLTECARQDDFAKRCGYFTRLPLKNPALVVFCLILAVSPCSAVFSSPFVFDVSLLTSALSPVPLWLRLAGGTGGISL
jgi:hypothetical protein